MSRDRDALMAGIRRVDGVTYSALVPNGRGYEAAVAAATDEVAQSVPVNVRMSRLLRPANP